MRRIPEHLAEGLDVRTGTLITGLRPEGDEWVASSPDGELRSDSVVLTAPLPQTIDLLDRAALPVDAR
ncbi:MAG: protoporphyrinogen oxidase, partial [Actinobacteria bacterium]|nr:protoporphyrinogen oxidase [Actinomycetota bacterium]NIS30401.1 protoporphyrinogen oxidase [Actinomycetota bacterium]NIU65631.1 protoporphyrinogen oxidase [Actinomycetota bacterium]NIW27435.1 protoporphyrinogen oxidase [Actinomycetota bacterium]NIX20838.1 protoporphyrinogen oxidase [Actinomycetota bacterium]